MSPRLPPIMMEDALARRKLEGIEIGEVAVEEQVQVQAPVHQTLLRFPREHKIETRTANNMVGTGVDEVDAITGERAGRERWLEGGLAVQCQNHDLLLTSAGKSVAQQVRVSGVLARCWPPGGQTMDGTAFIQTLLMRKLGW